MRQPTVLHFLGYDQDAGGVLTAIRLLAAQGGVRHAVVVNRGFRWRRVPRLAALRGPRVVCETISLGNFLRCLPATVRLLPAVERGRAMVHGQSRAGLLVALWLWLLGQDAVVTQPHSYGRQRWFYRWAALCLGEHWVWLSPAMKKYYGVGGSGWDGCIPEPLPPVAKLPRRLPDERIVLAGAGNIVRWKGWHLVPQALARLPSAVRARLVFRHAGEADDSRESRAYADELRGLTVELGLNDCVKWCGWRANMAEFWADADVAVVVSVNEPMALAGLEALAAGRPLIVADSGGLGDIVTPGRNALVFRTGDAASLAAVLQELVETDFLSRAEAGGLLPARVRAPEVAAAWRSIYLSVLGRTGEGGI
ncbi:MAG TPA: glycosyltransferase [Opitutaceae bacterium]|nr:glycosyltransferase [Opitutaceae bacterium]